MITELQIDSLEAAAASWVGTPFCEGSPVKGAGVSCHHLVAEVYFESGLIPRMDIPNGPSRYSPANTRSLIAEWVESCGLFVTIAKEGDAFAGIIQPGDFLGFRVVNAVHHAAIALRGGRIVHSVLGHGVIIAPGVPYAWERRLAVVWRPKSIA